jgi:hypothetical protein
LIHIYLYLVSNKEKNSEELCMNRAANDYTTVLINYNSNPDGEKVNTYIA